MVKQTLLDLVLASYEAWVVAGLILIVILASAWVIWKRDDDQNID